jgi:hypothetical protein
MYRGYIKERLTSFIVFFGVLGIMLILLGAVVDVPHTRRETISNPPYNPPGIWADANLTLRPGEFMYYSLDLVNENNSLIYVNVEKATGPVIFMINGSIGEGFNGSRTLTLMRIPQLEWPTAPFEYFWTPPTWGSWNFQFENPSGATDTINVTVKIIDYRYNAQWEERVTRYYPLLDRVFAYAGVAFITIAITPTAYDFYKKQKQKKPYWQEQAWIQKTREDEEKGKL